mmetsp:Transcript_19085/g.73439  ORF Transcript_19085/g.73439 Transcript_19085/m.73439 type:complete len:342 (-) Transcript_19085:229-1254(-)
MAKAGQRDLLSSAVPAREKATMAAMVPPVREGELGLAKETVVRRAVSNHLLLLAERTEHEVSRGLGCAGHHEGHLALGVHDGYAGVGLHQHSDHLCPSAHDGVVEASAVGGVDLVHILALREGLLHRHEVSLRAVVPERLRWPGGHCCHGRRGRRRVGRTPPHRSSDRCLLCPGARPEAVRRALPRSNARGGSASSGRGVAAAAGAHPAIALLRELAVKGALVQLAVEALHVARTGPRTEEGSQQVHSLAGELLEHHDALAQLGITATRRELELRTRSKDAEPLLPGGGEGLERRGATVRALGLAAGAHELHLERHADDAHEAHLHGQRHARGAQLCLHGL